MRSYCFAALCLCFLAGCGVPKAPSQTFHLTVTRDPANNDQRQQTTVTFRAPPRAEVIVEVGQDRDSITFDAKNSNRDRECVVRLVAERQQSQKNGKSDVEVFIRHELPNGDSAGGPSIYTVNANKPLKEVLNISVAEGDYSFDTPVAFGTLNGAPITLVLRPLHD